MLCGRSLSLNIQQPRKITEIDYQVVKNTDSDCRIERVLDIEQILLKTIDCHHPAAGIHNPIFTDAGLLVVVELADVIICRVARGDDLNDEIGGTVAPFSVQLAFVAYYHNIRLNDEQRPVRQQYIKRGAEDAACPFSAEDIVVYNSRKLHGNGLVDL